MKHLSAFLLGMSVFMANAGVTPIAPKNADAQLQAACVKVVKPTLKRGERIRDIGQSMGALDKNINFRVSANGEKMRVVSCQVQSNGSLEVVDKGVIEKAAPK